MALFRWICCVVATTSVVEGGSSQQTVRVGNVVNIVCTTPPGTKQVLWSRADNKPLPANSQFRNQFNSTLRIVSVTLADAGIYYCRAQGDTGVGSAVGAMIIVEDDTGGAPMSNAAIASIAACGTVVTIACAILLACILKRKLCLRQGKQEANRRETNEASAESQSGLLSHSGARDDECVYEFKTYANVPTTNASGPVLYEITLAESSYATLGSQPCDHVYGSLKA